MKFQLFLNDSKIFQEYERKNVIMMFFFVFSLKGSRQKSSFLSDPATLAPPRLSGHRNVFPYIKKEVIFS